MSIVTFPGLNLKFNISKIAFYFLNIPIYWYSICIVLGIVLSLLICSISKKTREIYKIKYDDFIEIIFFALIFGILRSKTLLCYF